MSHYFAFNIVIAFLFVMFNSYNKGGEEVVLGEIEHLVEVIYFGYDRGN